MQFKFKTSDRVGPSRPLFFKKIFPNQTVSDHQPSEWPSVLIVYMYMVRLERPRSFLFGDDCSMVLRRNWTSFCCVFWQNKIGSPIMAFVTHFTLAVDINSMCNSAPPPHPRYAVPVPRPHASHLQPPMESAPRRRKSLSRIFQCSRGHYRCRVQLENTRERACHCRTRRRTYPPF